MTEVAPRKRSPRKSRSTNTAKAATALRLRGAPYVEIAATLELASASEARALVERYLGANCGTPASREQERAESAARIDSLLRSVWRKAHQPTNPEHLPAVRTALALIDRRIRLMGSDAPAEVVLYQPTAMEMDAWVTSIIAATTVTAEVEEDDILSADIVEEGAEVRAIEAG